MRRTIRFTTAVGTGLILLAMLACSGAGSDAILDTDGGASLAFVPFAKNGRIPLEEGLNAAADPEAIVLDPCDADAPVDPDTGKLLGTATIGALLLDADLLPVVGAEVSFVTTAGTLASMGQPLATDDSGLVTDTLTVDEDDAGDVVVTVSSGDLTAEVTLPVSIAEKSPITVELSPAELWPPNHSMREVSAVFGGIDCWPEATFVLVSVTSDEPDDGIGDGSTEADIQGAEIGTADTSILLRAERAGGGDGRTYTATYDVADGEGGTATLTATARVPHDQGH